MLSLQCRGDSDRFGRRTLILPVNTVYIDLCMLICIMCDLEFGSHKKLLYLIIILLIKIVSDEFKRMLKNDLK